MDEQETTPDLSDEPTSGNDSDLDELAQDVEGLTARKPRSVHPPAPPRLHRAGKAPQLPPADSLRAEVYALTAAQQTMFERLDQLGKVLELDHAQYQALRDEMMDTLKILQEAFNQLDGMMDKVARITAALIKTYQLEIESQQETIF